MAEGDALAMVPGADSRITAWNIVVPALPEGQVAANMAFEPVNIVNNLKPYSLRNGRPEDIEPYLLTSAIPRVYHWVPINGVAPVNALKVVDAFIKCHMYQIESYPPTDMAVETRRKVAIILGTARAAMMANYDIGPNEMNAQELAAPVMAAAVPEAGAPVYTPLLANNAPQVDRLTGPLNLTAQELESMQVITRCAQAIIPVQGLNIITDGHHYLSEKSKASFKAFLAVERQVWVNPQFKTWISGIEDTVRDMLWHKAGHPVAVFLKEEAASRPDIKTRLELAKLGSAAARLPALESDLRAADTYLRLFEAVGAIWATVGGGIECDIFRWRVTVVKGLPRSTDEYVPEVNMGEGVTVRNRAAAVNCLKDSVGKATDTAAIAYGFYCAMTESGGGDGMGMGGDTLKAAFSLRKLRQNNIAPYFVGVELYKDYRSIKAQERKKADRKIATLQVPV